MTPKQIFNKIRKFAAGNRKPLLYIVGGIAAAGIVGGAILYSSGSLLQGSGAQSMAETSNANNIVVDPGIITIPIPSTSLLKLSNCEITPTNPTLNSPVNIKATITQTGLQQTIHATCNNISAGQIQQCYLGSGYISSTRTYTQYGDYPMIFNIHDGEGNSDEITCDASVKPNVTPTIVSCEGTPASEVIGAQITWTASAYGPLSGFTGFIWSGDATGAGKTVTTSYTTTGTKTASVTGKALGNDLNTDTCNVTINPLIPPLCSSFTYTEGPCVNGTQTLSVATKTPQNCVGGVVPKTSQACTLAPTFGECTVTPPSPTINDTINFKVPVNNYHAAFLFNGKCNETNTTCKYGIDTVANKYVEIDATYGTPGTYSATFSILDGFLEIGSKTCNATVTAGQQQATPKIDSCTPNPLSPTANTPMEYKLTTSNMNYTDYYFKWELQNAAGNPTNAMAGPTGLTLTYPQAGTYTMSVKIYKTSDNTVIDGETCSATVVAATPPSACTSNSYTFTDWLPSACTNGTQTRTVSARNPSNCTGDPATADLSRTCTPTPEACTYNYSDYGTCSSTGTQTRTVTSSTPTGCTGTPSSLTKSCTPACTSTSFSFTDWTPATCSNGTQTRTVSARNPSNCTGNPATADLSRTCTPTPNACTYNYSDYGTCSSTGTQTRTVTSSTPTGCTGTPSSLTKSCTPACTSYNYGAWGTCTNGSQSRTVSSTVPTVCTGGATQVLTQSCTTTPSLCTSYNYGAWGECTNGSQSRTVSSTVPTVCTGGATQVLTQSCTNESTETTTPTPTPTAPETPAEPSKCPGVNYPKDTSGHWAESLIKKSYDLCMFKGYVDGSFKPDQPITRAEALKTILSAAGIKPILGCYDADCGSPSTDLEMWQGQWVRAAWNLQIIKSSAKFRPNDSITRAEAAVIVANAFIKSGKVKIPLITKCYTPNCGAGYEKNFFLDIKDEWQGPAVRWLWDAQLTQGSGPNKFEPNKPITRAELTKLVMLAAEKK